MRYATPTVQEDIFPFPASPLSLPPLYTLFSPFLLYLYRLPPALSCLTSIAFPPFQTLFPLSLSPSLSPPPSPSHAQSSNTSTARRLRTGTLRLPAQACKENTITTPRPQSTTPGLRPTVHEPPGPRSRSTARSPQSTVHVPRPTLHAPRRRATSRVQAPGPAPGPRPATVALQV